MKNNWYFFDKGQQESIMLNSGSYHVTSGKVEI